MHVSFRLDAIADAQDAYSWYEDRRYGLGEEFLEELRSAVSRIIENPTFHSVVHRDTRRALLKRFPYGVFYRKRCLTRVPARPTPCFRRAVSPGPVPSTTGAGCQRTFLSNAAA